jgi:hypothetical protein
MDQAKQLDRNALGRRGVIRHLMRSETERVRNDNCNNEQERTKETGL